MLATGGGFGAGPGKIWWIDHSNAWTSGAVQNLSVTGAGAPSINLKSFEGKVTVFVDAGGGVGPASKGALSFSFDALESAGANTQPTIVTVPGGNASLTTPKSVPGMCLPLRRYVNDRGAGKSSVTWAIVKLQDGAY